MQRLAGIAAVAVVILAGCGGGGGAGGIEPGAVPADEAYFPLAVGNRWVYEYRAPQIAVQQGGEPIADRSTREVVGTTVLGGKQWFELVLKEWSAELGESQPIDVLHVWVRETDAGVYLWHTTRREAVLWIKKPPRVGLQWAGLGLLGDGYDWLVQADDDTITVPYGTVQGCVRIVEREPEDPEAGVRHEWVRWFKKGVGMVAEQYWHIPNDPQGPWDETALIECEIKR